MYIYHLPDIARTLKNANTLPYDEAKRLEALDSYHILDTLEEKDYDDLTALAAAICGVPIALISLVDKDRQWFKSHRGLAARETPINQSFCAHAIVASNDIMIVEDARKDDRFKDNPLVTGHPNISFYAGVPLTSDDGYSLGTLCVIDSKKNSLSLEQQSALKIVGQQVMDKLELRRKIRVLEATDAELKNAVEDLSVSESKLRAIINQAPIGIGVLRSSSLIIDTANDDLLKVWGKTNEIIGKPIATILTHENELDTLDTIKKVFDSGIGFTAQDIAVEIVHLEETKHCYLNVTYHPILDQYGKTEQILLLVIDVTQQRELSLQKDDFISIASHELKTPITSVRASLQLLDRMKDSPNSPMIPKLIDQANRSIIRINTLVDDLLNVGRLSGGQLQLSRATFKVADLLENCCSHVRAIAKHELIFEGDDSILVFADEHRIDQVVLNLVNNAVKYAPNSKEIYLNLEKHDGYAKVSIRDSGPGIEPDQLAHLFGRYYRADYQGAQYSGLGLGLYICAEIIRKHGGEIGVDSTLGEGSTFWFKLPI
jgi:signal transduction histidine kinase